MKDDDLLKNLSIIQRKMENGLGEIKNAVNINTSQTTYKLLTLETRLEVFGEILKEMAMIITHKSEEQLDKEFKQKWGRAFTKNHKEYEKMQRQTNPFAGIKLNGQD